jgi:hypothetical protein
MREATTGLLLGWSLVLLMTHIFDVSILPSQLLVEYVLFMAAFTAWTVWVLKGRR